MNSSPRSPAVDGGLDQAVQPRDRFSIRPFVFYGTLCSIASSLVTWIAWEHGGSLFPLALAPILSVILMLTRYAWLAIGVPVSILLAILADPLPVWNFFAAEEHVLVNWLIVVSIAASFRMHVFSSTVVPQRLLMSRFSETPRVSARSLPPWGIPQLASGLIIAVSCLLGTICAPYVDILRDIPQDGRLRLNRDWYLVICLLLFAGFAVWVSNHLLNHVSHRFHGKASAAIHLLQEVWSWNGGEQRRISRELRKNAQCGIRRL